MSDFELADDFLPIYDVCDAVATVADADRQKVWRALVDVDLLKLGREAPLVGMLGALRMLPEIVGHVLHGERGGGRRGKGERSRGGRLRAVRPLR